MIPVEDCVVTLTHFGYIKRQPVDTYKTQRRGGRGISGMARREEDFVEELFICSTHDYIMFFSNRGRVYRLKGYEIAESSRASKGINMINLLPLEKDEKITSMIRMSEFEEDSFLVMVTKQGVIKRTETSSYRNVRKGGLIAINLDEGDELAWVRQTDGQSQLIVATKNGMAIRFEEQDARALGRTARGVKAITLEEGDEVVGMAVVNEGEYLLTVSENGQGRKTFPDEYRIQSRGGKGIRNYYTDKNGPVAGVLMVNDEDDIFVISEDGVIIRTNVAEIAQQSRYGGGVRVMRIQEDNKVVALARAPKEVDSAEEAEPQEAEGESPAAQEPSTEE